MKSLAQRAFWPIIILVIFGIGISDPWIWRWVIENWIELAINAAGAIIMFFIGFFVGRFLW